MPRFVYKPEGVDPQTWDFTFGRFMSPERMAMEKLTGLTWVEFQAAFWRESTAAVHAVLYVLMKRERPTIKPDEVVFCDDDYDLDLTDDEARESVTKYIDNPEAEALLDADDQATLAALRERVAALGAEEEADPKES